MTGSINLYLPDPAWDLIFEFHNAAPLRQEKRAIAEACAECVCFKNRERAEFLEQRGLYLELQQALPPEHRLVWNALLNTTTWEKVQQPHWHPDRRFPALIDQLKGIW